VKTRGEWEQLHTDRVYLGGSLGSLEAWLLLRSLRTLHLRVTRQSTTATELARWLDSIRSTRAGETKDGAPGGVIEKVWHSSLQKGPRDFEPAKQLEGGFNATFSILVIFFSYFLKNG
jgi:cystathionine gamma-synthase